MDAPKWLCVGYITGTHGLRGEVRVASRTDSPEERFAVGKEVYLSPSEGEDLIPLQVERSRPHKKGWLIKFHGWDRIEEAEQYKGGKLVVCAAEEDLEEEEYYFYQIIGCQVVTTEGRELGEVVEIIQTGANDVWVVRPADGGRDLLIPYIDQVVKEVDVESKQVVIQWMEGLG